MLWVFAEGIHEFLKRFRHNAGGSMEIKNLISIEHHVLYVQHISFIPQNRLNLFIQVIGWYLKTFIFDNSCHSPKTATLRFCMWSEEAVMLGGGVPYRTSSPDLD